MKNINKFSIIIIIGTLLLVAGLVAYSILSQDPNFILRHESIEIKEDNPVQVSFESVDAENEQIIMPDPVIIRFTPGETSEYKFVVSDIKSSAPVSVETYVMDENFTDYLDFTVLSQTDETFGHPEILSGKTFLQEGCMVYISFDINPTDSDATQVSGSMNITVSKSTEADKPEEIKADQSINLRILANEQQCASFKPEITGYYRFDTTILRGGASSGFSSISAVTAADSLKVNVTNGLCYLEKGKEYYIWVTVNETGRRRSLVSLECSSLSLIKAYGSCELDLEGESLIEYRAASNDPVAIYSESKGDPSVMLFDKTGFAMRSDDDSAGSLSDNKNDFAIVFQPSGGKVYRVCVFGDISGCKIMIGKYTGDGSSITKDDVESEEGGASENAEEGDVTADEAETDHE